MEQGGSPPPGDRTIRRERRASAFHLPLPPPPVVRSQPSSSPALATPRVDSRRVTLGATAPSSSNAAGVSFSTPHSSLRPSSPAADPPPSSPPPSSRSHRSHHSVDPPQGVEEASLFSRGLGTSSRSRRQQRHTYGRGGHGAISASSPATHTHLQLDPPSDDVTHDVISARARGYGANRFGANQFDIGDKVSDGLGDVLATSFGDDGDGEAYARSVARSRAHARTGTRGPPGEAHDRSSVRPPAHVRALQYGPTSVDTARAVTAPQVTAPPVTAPQDTTAHARTSARSTAFGATAHLQDQVRATPALPPRSQAGAPAPGPAYFSAPPVLPADAPPPTTAPGLSRRAAPPIQPAPAVTTAPRLPGGALGTHQGRHSSPHA